MLLCLVLSSRNHSILDPSKCCQPYSGVNRTGKRGLEGSRKEK